MKSIINVLAKMEFMNLWSGRPLRWPFWNIEMSKSKLYHKIFELKDRHRGNQIEGGGGGNDGIVIIFLS